MAMTTRAVKGSALTHTEMDTNFTELAGHYEVETLAEARALTGGVYPWIYVRDLDRVYIWVSDSLFNETAANDVLLPNGHSGAGRWTVQPRLAHHPKSLTLPRLTAGTYDLADDLAFKVMIFGDSLTAKYTTAYTVPFISSTTAAFPAYMTRLCGGKRQDVLSAFYAVTGGVPGGGRSALLMMMKRSLLLAIITR